MKILTLFLLLLIQMTSFALPWHSVDENEALLAACTDFRPPTESQMIDFLNSLTVDSDVRIDRQVRGVNFKNEIPELINLFEGIHAPIISLSSKTELERSNCDKVLCTMEQYYGKGVALRMLYIFAKFGVSTSPAGTLAPDNYQSWKLSEINDVMVALESIPPNFLPLKDRHLVHFKSGYVLKADRDELVLANSRMDVFDRWNTEPRAKRIETLIHEFGHVLANKLDESTEWTSLPRKLISQYAATNAKEDFAESFAAYRMAPRKLKQVSPERYEFLRKKLFNGLEFKKNKDCEQPFVEFQNSIASKTNLKRELLDWTSNHQKEIAEETKRQEEHGYFVGLLWKSCGDFYLNEKNGGSRTDTSTCIERIVKKRSALLKLREQGHEGINEQQIPTTDLSKVIVSKRAASYFRQEIRLFAVEHLKDYYAKKFWFYSGAAECKNDVDHSVHYDTDQQITKSRDTLAVILNQACERIESGSLWEKWMGPNFGKILP